MNFMMKPMRSLSLPLQAWKEDGWNLFPPTKAMKNRFLVLAALVVLFVLGMTGLAMAADDPITLNMDLSAKRFSGPA